MRAGRGSNSGDPRFGVQFQFGMMAEGRDKKMTNKNVIVVMPIDLGRTRIFYLRQYIEKSTDSE